MSDQRYDIYFTGQLVEGVALETAKQHFTTLFKAAPDHVEKIFNGKPQLLKKDVSKEAALKYKSVLHKAGMMTAFKAHQSITQVEEPTAQENIAAQNTVTQTGEPTSAEFSLAPVGSDVLKENERTIVEAKEIDTSNIKMVSAFMDLEPEPKEIPPAPDTSHISVAAAGADILAEKPHAPEAPPMNLDAITLAPPGTELEELHEELPELNPDTSQLSIAEAGADLLEGQIKPADPAPPNTDHISIKQE